MNENAKKWVAALRSGEYKQVTGMLHERDGGFCCLGVACDLYAKETGLVGWSEPKNSSPYMEFGESGNAMILPGHVQRWIGLRTDNGTIDHYSCLASMNDNGKNFSEIADFIESEPGGLFVEEQRDD